MKLFGVGVKQGDLVPTVDELRVVGAITVVERRRSGYLEAWHFPYRR